MAAGAAGGGRARVVRRRIDRLEEALVEAPLVVNATGLAAGALCGDPEVVPARGQIVLVANTGVVHLGPRRGRPGHYVHPRSRDVVLGGTWQEGDWNTVPDPATRDAIGNETTNAARHYVLLHF